MLFTTFPGHDWRFAAKQLVLRLETSVALVSGFIAFIKTGAKLEEGVEQLGNSLKLLLLLRPMFSLFVSGSRAHFCPSKANGSTWELNEGTSMS